MSDSGLMWIKDKDDNQLALVVRRTYCTDNTQFLTPDNFIQQLGFIVYKAGQTIIPHDHKPLERTIVGTSEVLLIKQGEVEAHIFDKNRHLVTTVDLYENDVILLVSGGHGFKIKKDAVMVEIKQGPYAGMEDKERFKW